MKMVLEFYINWTLWGIFITVIVLTKLIEALRRSIRLPPGPWGLPITGYLPFLRHDTHIHFKELAAKYGSVFSTRLGNKLIVVMSDYRMIREAFSKEEFTGRPDTEFSNILGGYGVVNSDGRLWKDQRRFLHEKLRHFGVTYAGAGKEQMQSKIMQEVGLFLQALNDCKEKTVDLEPMLALSISNVICSIMMSVRFQQQDPKFCRFMNLIAEGFRLFGRMTYVNFIPVLRYLPGLQATRKQIAHNRSEMADFFQETVDNHRETFDPCNMRDMIDNYLLVIQEAQANGRGGELFEGKNHDRQIQQIIGDLFSAGMETIKTTIQWAVVFMLHHPDVATQIQKELDTVVGRKRLPELKDRPYLPYTEATILEVLRISSVVPLGTTHATTRDVKLGGYWIPKDTQIVPLLHAVHLDPNLWDEPELFKPERFINVEGKVSKPDYFLPFGVGRRMCLGDVLARMEVFLFFSSLLHCYNVKVPEGDKLPSLNGVTGVTLTPEKFKVCLEKRHLEDCDFDFLTESSEIIATSFRSVGSH